eukprot:GHUV01011044.1.p1 GENE.GHUV01011044.1~~GHUV01011044.1.p1  ORF type:complete len:296 (+),score=41.51 GHUV01011044.1:476-1363(+)
MNLSPSFAPELPAGYDLRLGTSKEDYTAFARLACAYHAWLNVDLCFQNFEQELASLPGSYGAPAGCILLISHLPTAADHNRQQEHPVDVACVAVRPLEQHHGKESFGCLSTAAIRCNGVPAEQQQPGAAAPDSSSAIPYVSGTCELKRLWVEQPHQQHGLGRILTTAAVEAAKQMGYKTMVLDTLETLTSANRLYEKLGFVRRKPYYYNPLPGEHVTWLLHRPLMPLACKITPPAAQQTLRHLGSLLDQRQRPLVVLNVVEFCSKIPPYASLASLRMEYCWCLQYAFAVVSAAGA